MKAIGASSLVGFTGYAGAQQGQQNQQASDDDGSTDDQGGMRKRVPVIDIPVINGYYDGDEVWFLHTDASEQQMAKMMTEMIDYPTYHTPALADAADHDEAAPIYVFTNGIDQSDEEPWGGGLFNYQIDVLDSVPTDDDYTSLRNPHRVTWEEDADPRILTSEEEVVEADEAGELTVKRTEMIVTAPVVSWPGSSETVHMGGGPSGLSDMNESGMDEQCPMCENGSERCPMHGGNDSGMGNTSDTGDDTDGRGNDSS